MGNYSVVSNFVSKGKSTKLKKLVYGTGFVLSDRLGTNQIKAIVNESIPVGRKHRIYYVRFEKNGELHRDFRGRISSILKELKMFHHNLRYYS